MTLTARAAWRRAGLVLAVVLAADQAVKAIVRGAIERGDHADLALGIQLVNTRNSGVAFGALQDGGAIIAVVGVVAVVALLTYFALNATRRWVWLPVGMLLGGAIGNAIDRIALGSVVDFIDFPAWPAFNVADICITVGVGILLLVIEFGDEPRSPR